MIYTVLNIVTLLFMQEAKELFEYFDKDGEGGISVDEFMVAFRVSGTCGSNYTFSKSNAYCFCHFHLSVATPRKNIF